MALVMSCCPPPSVPLLRVSFLRFSVALRRFCRTLLSLRHGRPLSQASSLVNGSVPASGNRPSSGPGGPAAWYCPISWHHHSVRLARRKVVTLLRSSLPRTSEVVSLMSCVSFVSLSHRYLHSHWRELRALHPSSPPPRSGTSFGRVVVLHCLGDSRWTWT